MDIHYKSLTVGKHCMLRGYAVSEEQDFAQIIMENDSSSMVEACKGEPTPLSTSTRMTLNIFLLFLLVLLSEKAALFGILRGVAFTQLDPSIES